MMKKFLYLFIFFLNFSNLLAIESKIIYKIQNEIITNIDIKNEYSYLLALNNKLQDLDKERIFKIAKESIIREKIKKIELVRSSIDVDIEIIYQDELVESIYLKLNLRSVSDFKKYLKTYNLKYENIIKKIKIDALWNELIIMKYESKVEINLDDIKNRLNNKKLTTKNYLLSEIVFEIKNKGELESKFLDIKKSIEEVGFENTASIYSISDSGKTGGNIGWVDVMSLNRNIQDNIESLDIGNISSPIMIPGGVLILKVNDLKEEAKTIDFDLELKRLIALERNKQLNQYSKIYFNKARKNLTFDD